MAKGEAFKRWKQAKALKEGKAKLGRPYKEAKEAASTYIVDPKRGSEEETKTILKQTKKAFSKSAKATAEELLWQVGGHDAKSWTASLLKQEWAIKYSSFEPRRYLEEIKGYTVGQATRILAEIPKGEFDASREDLLDAITTDLVKRQVDLIAEVQNTHITGSKILLTRAIEALSKNSMKSRKKNKAGEWEDFEAPLRSVDMLNLATSLEKAQQIYRRAMGLPNEEGGMAQIIEKINIMQEQSRRNTAQINIQNNVHIHSPKKSKVDQLAENLTHEDIMEFVKYRRNQFRKSEENKELEYKNGQDNK